jgi:hypothetical protein
LCTDEETKESFDDVLEQDCDFIYIIDEDDMKKYNARSKILYTDKIPHEKVFFLDTDTFICDNIEEMLVY